MLKIAFQAAVAAALLSAPALAQENLPDVSVSYADLDLSSPAGVQSLDRRLSAAVKAACPDDRGIRDAARLQEVSQCRTAKRKEVSGLREVALARAAGEKKMIASAR